MSSIAEDPPEGGVVAICQQGSSSDSAGGFAIADADKDDSVSSKELRIYLRSRLDVRVPFRRIFKSLDKDQSGGLSDVEFQTRQEVIGEYLEGDDFTQGEMEDPGPSFRPYSGLVETIDDQKISDALYLRYDEERGKPDWKWEAEPMSKIPRVSKLPLQKFFNQKAAPVSLDNLMKATMVVVGGGDNSFGGGAVVISPDGLAITNYHIAENMAQDKMVAMSSEGKIYRVTKLLAADSVADVALIQIEGVGLPYVSIASEPPSVGANIEMVHHSEEQFYTYDRGYVMRYPYSMNTRWMQISADYAPGGSGCGIYNDKRELVGVVCLIEYGSNRWGKNKNVKLGDDLVLLVKHAVPVSAIHSLFQFRSTDGS